MLLALVGPTASGKTEAAIEIAARLGAEIVSVDSMLVYRGMDVGTAKPTLEQRAGTPHHLIDVAEPEETFTVARYQALAREAIEGVRARGHRVLLVGGSGLYLRAVVDDLELPATDPAVRRRLEADAERLGALDLYERLAERDPAAAERIEPANVRRTVRALEVAELTGRPFSSFAAAWDRYEPDRLRGAGLSLGRDELSGRIAARVDGMIEGGLLDEVRGLVARGLGDRLTASQAIGYAEFARHLAGELSLEDAVTSTIRRTRALARRQLAWFRRDPRIRWFEVGPSGAGAVVDDIAGYLDG